MSDQKILLADLLNQLKTANELISKLSLELEKEKSKNKQLSEKVIESKISIEEKDKEIQLIKEQLRKEKLRSKRLLESKKNQKKEYEKKILDQHVKFNKKIINIKKEHAEAIKKLNDKIEEQNNTIEKLCSERDRYNVMIEANEEVIETLRKDKSRLQKLHNDCVANHVKSDNIK